MTLKDLSKIVIDSMNECITHEVNIDDVSVYFIRGDNGVLVNYAQLRFSDEIKSGILILDNTD